MKLSKRIGIFIGIIVVIAVIFFVEQRPIVQYATNVITLVKEYSDGHPDLVEQLQQEIFTQPLRGNISSVSAPLSPDGIIGFTNNERLAAGIPLLKESALLDAAAQRKVQDMFDHQYFDHISPAGNGPGALATNAGYSYIVIGENLALGNFKSDQDLVNAWMNSPGHRANMLNKRYQDIGVAVGHGTFNGERVWLAVQEFGKPSSACPTVSFDLKTQIEKDKTTVSQMDTDLSTKRTALEAMPHTTVEESTAYNAKVTEYNAEVNQYNTLLTALRQEIDTYNTAVENFNTCARR